MKIEGDPLSFPRVIIIGSVCLFGLIGVMALIKNKGGQGQLVEQSVLTQVVEEIPSYEPVQEEAVIKSARDQLTVRNSDDFPTANRINDLFSVDSINKLPIVETISYTSRVPWLKGKPAWIADYASYFSTSRHFIARSLNGKRDYNTQKVSFGSRFNVFRKDKDIEFHLLLDLSRCKLGFFYLDRDTNERVQVKSYSVGVGRLNEEGNPESLTPLGVYKLGEKVAIYDKGTMGYFEENKIEMIRVFGTRWLPFAHGCGLHGAPWIDDEKTGKLVENRASIGQYGSKGCIRLLHEDVEELFAIVITKPTYLHVVNDFNDAQLPGKESLMARY